MTGEAYKERIPYLYAVTYGWPGLPTTTRIVDLQRTEIASQPTSPTR